MIYSINDSEVINNEVLVRDVDRDDLTLLEKKEINQQFTLKESERKEKLKEIDKLDLELIFFNITITLSILLWGLLAYYFVG